MDLQMPCQRGQIVQRIAVSLSHQCIVSGEDAAKLFGFVL